MGNRFRQKFEDDRITDFAGGSRGLLLGDGGEGLDGGNTVGLEQLLGLEFGEDGATGLTRRFNQRFGERVMRSASVGGGDERGGFVKPPQVVAVSPHVVEDADGGVRVRKGGDVGAIQNRLTRGDVGSTHPTGQDRFTLELGVGLQALRRLRGIGHGLRRQDHEHAIAARVAGHDLHGFRVAFGVGIAEHIDGVGVAPMRREQAVERSHGLLRKLRHLASLADQRIGGQHAGAAGVGHDGEARTARARLLGEDLGHVKQVGDIVDAQHAGATERGFQNLIAARKRARMRRRGLRGSFGAAGLNHDDGLGEGDLAGGGQERARIADRFHVEDDAARARVVSEVIDKVAPTHIEHRAD